MAVPSNVVQIDPRAWVDALAELFVRVVAPFSGRCEPGARVRSYLLGLLSSLERKNGWWRAEFASDAEPDGMQRRLNHA
ncbi:hypothetical protein AB0C69_33820 [Actinomadura sp. NPDC048032]|uniref:hypothetical protein n=1 Tax=Actinomadura sp. NPDC048032 TaxID=3155747 RepID=UPI0033E87083